jgi:hypothetical protein
VSFDSISEKKVLVFLVFVLNYVIDFNVQGTHSKTAFKIYAFPNFHFSHFFQEVEQDLIMWIRSDEKGETLANYIEKFSFLFFSSSLSQFSAIKFYTFPYFMNPATKEKILKFLCPLV